MDDSLEQFSVKDCVLNELAIGMVKFDDMFALPSVLPLVAVIMQLPAAMAAILLPETVHMLGVVDTKLHGPGPLPPVFTTILTKLVVEPALMSVPSISVTEIGSWLGKDTVTVTAVED